MKKFTIKNKIWLWNGMQGSWHFVHVSEKDSKAIKKAQPSGKGMGRGFGAVKIKATLGKTSWTTSIFPTKEGPYVLPIKAAVRTKEMAQEGDQVTIKCELI